MIHVFTGKKTYTFTWKLHLMLKRQQTDQFSGVNVEEDTAAGSRVIIIICCDQWLCHLKSQAVLVFPSLTLPPLSLYLLDEYIFQTQNYLKHFSLEWEDKGLWFLFFSSCQCERASYFIPVIKDEINYLIFSGCPCLSEPHTVLHVIFSSWHHYEIFSSYHYSIITKTFSNCRW